MMLVGIRWSELCMEDLDLSSYKAVFQRPSWELMGACHDKPTEWFFSKKQAEIIAATTLCQICAVRWTCLSQNIDVPFGIFGGLTAIQRKELREQLTVVNPELLQLLIERSA